VLINSHKNNFITACGEFLNMMNDDLFLLPPVFIRKESSYDHQNYFKVIESVREKKGSL
jgi:hypothetical protein